jgi:pimeloyl-ACP methyl ester carboxylesterase
VNYPLRINHTRSLYFSLTFILALLSAVPGMTAAQPPTLLTSPLQPIDLPRIMRIISYQIPTFNRTPCMFEVSAGVVIGPDVQCGYLTVLEEHANSNGPTIQLAVVIIKSKDPNPRPDPLFIAQGGPGGSTIDTYAEHLITNSRLRSNRDIVLFDQRGTLYSKPALMCKEIDQLTMDTLDKDLSPDEYMNLDIQAADACHARLAREGDNVEDFNSLENAADIEDLRLALGYDKINLYGVSYGTLLALHMMHLFPQGLRSVILDGVVPPQINTNLESARTFNRSFSNLMDSCANDPVCNRAYPNLEQVFFEVVDKLNKNPVKLKMTDPKNHITYDALMDGDSFMGGLFQMLYVTDLIPALPRMIYDAANENFNFFANITPFFIFDFTTSYGMYYSVWCAEDSDFNPSDMNLTGVRPQIVEFERRGPSELLQICKDWNVKQLSPAIDQPITSDIPTLLLSGGYDPVTPPEYAVDVAKTLSHNYSFVFPTGAHGQAMGGPCQDGIIQAFLDDPSKQPDGSCIAGISKVQFFTRTNMIDVPVLMKMLNLEPIVLLELLVFVLSSIFMLTSLITFPLAWSISRSSRKSVLTTPNLEILNAAPTLEPPARHPYLVHIANWVAAINSLILPVFTYGLFTVSMNMINTNDNRLFWGVPASAGGWFVLPLVFTFLGIVMMIACVQAWRLHAWRATSRLYYTLLCMAALVCAVILGLWGLLTAFI